MRILTILFAASVASLASCEEEEVAPPPPLPPPAAAVVVVPPAAPVAIVPTAAVSLTTATKAPFGTYLVDGAGRSLYILEGTRGETGVSRCTPDCLQVWPPLQAPVPVAAGSGVDPAKLLTVPLNGAPHVTYAGWPLYYYSRDGAPGETNGQHVSDQWGTWHLLAPSGEPIRPAGGY